MHRKAKSEPFAGLQCILEVAFRHLGYVRQHVFRTPRELLSSPFRIAGSGKIEYHIIGIKVTKVISYARNNPHISS